MKDDQKNNALAALAETAARFAADWQARVPAALDAAQKSAGDTVKLTLTLTLKMESGLINVGGESVLSKTTRESEKYDGEAIDPNQQVLDLRAATEKGAAK